MSLVFNAASRLEEIASVMRVLMTLKSAKFSSKISSKLSAYNGPRNRLSRVATVFETVAVFL
jgi:hypothetical protein